MKDRKGVYGRSADFPNSRRSFGENSRGEKLFGKKDTEESQIGTKVKGWNWRVWRSRAPENGLVAIQKSKER